MEDNLKPTAKTDGASRGAARTSAPPDGPRGNEGSRPGRAMTSSAQRDGTPPWGPQPKGPGDHRRARARNRAGRAGRVPHDTTLGASSVPRARYVFTGRDGSRAPGGRNGNSR